MSGMADARELSRAHALNVSSGYASGRVNSLSSRALRLWMLARLVVTKRNAEHDTNNMQQCLGSCTYSELTFNPRSPRYDSDIRKWF